MWACSRAGCHDILAIEQDVPAGGLEEAVTMDTVVDLPIRSDRAARHPARLTVKVTSRTAGMAE